MKSYQARANGKGVKGGMITRFGGESLQMRFD